MAETTRSTLASKVWVGFTSALLLFFSAIAVYFAVAFMSAPQFVAKAIGVAVIVVVVLGLLLLARELRFGLQTERLAGILAADGGLPADDLPRSPGGRIDRAAADAQFETCRAEVEAAPRDWRARYRLSLAYDAAGDRRRARAAARDAVRLHAEG
ncbi:hypothetical protein [Micrococcus sp. M4NT]|uniref:hypothetical protein n=1 Tax=Micrococcus sp. M4NT TaxID=2957501 RepID=UPI00260531D3|nr:hypothetical protein [Micrococcus sp. M4NT]MDX2340831.1 hypothetical protein [Micrococcus sp. M4NT]